MVIFAQVETLSSWLVNPGLLAAGAAATALPIVIHLLNRRRFKVVDWAAMEFLLEAQQQNRRRLQLENLLLLVLRCLAVFLIGMLLARPFLPGALASLADSKRFERIVVLDDSLSMQARVENESAWDVARRRVIELVTSLSQEGADDSLTVVLATRPEQPVLDTIPLTIDKLDEVRARMEELECKDERVVLASSLAALADRLESEKTDVSRVVQLFTDLRRIDWGGAGGRESQGELLTQLKRLAKAVQGCTVFDAASDDDQNVSIVDVRSEGLLVTGMPSALEVLVKNQGSATANELRLTMTPQDVLPIEMDIPEIKPQETATVRFPFLLGEPPTARQIDNLEPRRVTIALSGKQQGATDQLAADDVAFFPARLSRGIAVLVIDGDPSEQYGEAESFYLERALAPGGPVPSGVITNVVRSSASEGVDFKEYQVVFLLNVDRISDAPLEEVAELERWVKEGGGLVIMPGDRVDAPTFNAHFWKNGAGLSPLPLDHIRGDPSRTNWARIEIENAHHEVLKQFAGQDNLLLAGVKVFRWWGAHGEAAQAGNSITVGAKFNDREQSPLLCERAVGNGRVILFTIPADADWHDWPSDPSYLLLMQDLVRSLASSRETSGMLRVGDPLVASLDIARYEVETALTGPGESQAKRQAAPSEATSHPEDAAHWQVSYPDTPRQGFYTLSLTGRDGRPETRLFAANVAPEEGDLRRVDKRQLDRALAGTNIRVLNAADPALLAGKSQRTEISHYLLWVVAVVLASEQVLGWWFGRRRT